MVRALIRRVLGRQENDQSTPQLELPPTDSRDRARSMVMGLQDEICAGLEALDGEGDSKKKVGFVLRVVVAARA